MTLPWKVTLYLNSGTLFCPGPPPMSLDPPFQASLLVTYQYSGIKILERHRTLSLVLFYFYSPDDLTLTHEIYILSISDHQILSFSNLSPEVYTCLSNHLH